MNYLNLCQCQYVCLSCSVSLGHTPKSQHQFKFLLHFTLLFLTLSPASSPPLFFHSISCHPKSSYAIKSAWMRIQKVDYQAIHQHQTKVSERQLKISWIHYHWIRKIALIPENEPNLCRYLHRTTSNNKTNQKECKESSKRQLPKNETKTSCAWVRARVSFSNKQNSHPSSSTIIIIIVILQMQCNAI